MRRRESRLWSKYRRGRGKTKRGPKKEHGKEHGKEEEQEQVQEQEQEQEQEETSIPLHSFYRGVDGGCGAGGRGDGSIEHAVVVVLSHVIALLLPLHGLTGDGDELLAEVKVLMIESEGMKSARLVRRLQPEAVVEGMVTAPDLSWW